jgi:hypothetical protein
MSSVNLKSGVSDNKPKVKKILSFKQIIIIESYMNNEERLARLQEEIMKTQLNYQK